MVYTCVKCNKKFEDEATITSDGVYCPTCSIALPPPRVSLIRPIVDDLIVESIFDIAKAKLPSIKTKHEDIISKYGIEDDEILNELKRRLRRLR